MDDAARIKIPTIVCHSLDSYFVFAGEGNVYKVAAITERPIPDARHARRDRHRRQTAATAKRLITDGRHARRDRQGRQTGACGKRSTTDARHVGSNFNSLRFFRPVVFIFIKYPSVDHRLLGYLV